MIELWFFPPFGSIIMLYLFILKSIATGISYSYMDINTHLATNVYSWPVPYKYLTAVSVTYKAAVHNIFSLCDWNLEACVLLALLQNGTWLDQC